MTDMNYKRLLNVARALRESYNPDDFNMYLYVHPCGSPACALGHYAARPDLQDMFHIRERHRMMVRNAESGRWFVPDYDAQEVQDHFGIDDSQADELFSADGCGGARTVDAAAEYIEDFVTKHKRSTGEERGRND